jgi:CheY-like chemotaxis protein
MRSPPGWALAKSDANQPFEAHFCARPLSGAWALVSNSSAGSLSGRHDPRGAISRLLHRNRRADVPNGDQAVVTGSDRPQRPLKVFLVEDSRFMRERIIEKIASTRQTEFVGSAETASDAVDRLSKLDCDAIVLDINLARGNGFEVLRSIRANNERRPRVIIFTNYAYPYYRQLTMEMGADFFLDKATEFNRLLEIIEGLSAVDGAGPS